MTTRYGLVSGGNVQAAITSLGAKLEEQRVLLENIAEEQEAISESNRRIRDATEGTAMEVTEDPYPLEDSDDDDDA